jgi:hypothetical protein
MTNEIPQFEGQTCSASHPQGSLHLAISLAMTARLHYRHINTNIVDRVRISNPSIHPGKVCDAMADVNDGLVQQRNARKILYHSRYTSFLA